jgi:hypothetical protein
MHVHVIGRGSKYGALSRSFSRWRSVASGWLGWGDGMILSTVQGVVVLGSLGIRVVSRIGSIILADLDMRGFAISFLTLACVVSARSFLRFLCRMRLS